jgi:hypothetical protein
MNHIIEINPYFNSLENLLGFIESYNPSEVIIFSPRLNIGFLWKFIDDISLYRKKNIEKFHVYFSRFDQSYEFHFSLNECIELQELFPKIKTFYVDLDKITSRTNLFPGIIYLNGDVQKTFSFEFDFSSQGFDLNGVISAISLKKSQSYFSELIGNSITINRKNLDLIIHSYSSLHKNKAKKTPENLTIPTFNLSFLSSRTGKIHNAGAGLNWGQPTTTRKRKDLNAAYVAVPTYLQKSSILPLVNHNFLCIFEDGIEIEMVRTGQNGKNLTSSYENQFFGRYVRCKLGLPPGVIITDSDLIKAGFFGLSFYKIESDHYFIKFE